MGIRTNGDSVPEIAKLSQKWEDFDKKTCQTTGISRAKHTFSGNGKSENVANYSRTNGNSNKWGFGAEKLAQKTKMGSHLFASILYPVFFRLISVNIIVSECQNSVRFLKILCTH